MMFDEIVLKRKPRYCDRCGNKLEAHKWKYIDLTWNQYTGKRITETNRAMICADCEVIWTKHSHQKEWVERDNAPWVKKIREWVDKGKPRFEIIEETWDE